MRVTIKTVTKTILFVIYVTAMTLFIERRTYILHTINKSTRQVISRQYQDKRTANVCKYRMSSFGTSSTRTLNGDVRKIHSLWILVFRMQNRRLTGNIDSSVGIISRPFL